MTQLNLKVHIYEPLGGDSRGPMAPVLRERDRITQNIVAILFTRKGEWPGKPWQGNALQNLLYEPDDEITMRAARAMTEGQIRRYEPHLDLTAAVLAMLTDDEGNPLLRIDLRGVMLRTNDIYSTAITVRP